MTEQVLDLRRVIASLRRRWPLLVGLIAVGLVSAFAMSILQPPTFVARSTVLLPPGRVDSQGRALRNMITESQLATSAEILERAGKALRPPAGVAVLLRRVRARPLSTDILEVQAKGRTSRAAVLMADAVAKEYVAYANGATSDLVDTSVAVLEAQASELDQRIRGLDADIARNTAAAASLVQRSPEALRLDALIDSLRSAQVDAGRQLSTLQTRLAESRLQAELTRRGTRLLGSTSNAEGPSVTSRLRTTASGGLIGILAGATVVLLAEYRDRRLRNRDQIAESAAAPVLASLQVPRDGNIESCAAALERWEPSVVENIALRQAFTDLGVADADPPADVVVVTLPGDRAAVLLAAKLAAFAATAATRTDLIVATQHATVEALRSACRMKARPRPYLRLHAGVTDVTPEDLGWAELTVTVATADASPLAVPTWARRRTTALGVSAGFATAETVASTALACLDAGHPITGILVANPDPSDHTIGRLHLPSPARGILSKELTVNTAGDEVQAR